MTFMLFLLEGCRQRLPSSGLIYQAIEKRSSAALRCEPHRSTYFYIRLTLRFLRALHLTIFEQPA
jgi:hypothetical protein